MGSYQNNDFARKEVRIEMGLFFENHEQSDERS